MFLKNMSREGDHARRSLALVVLALAMTLGSPPAAPAQTGGSGTQQGVHYKWINCGNVTPYARSTRSIGQNHVAALKCGSARKVVRNWIRLERCGADVGDDCRFWGWECFVGRAPHRPSRRVVACSSRSWTRTITFTSRYR
jgi:hypothetical protein